MFMQRIDIPTVATRRRPVALKLGAGLLFLCLSAIIAPVWFVATALWFSAAALIRGLGGLAVQLWKTTIWAGELVVGR